MKKYGNKRVPLAILSRILAQSWINKPSLELTSAKIIPLNEWGCRDEMHHVKKRGNKEIPLALLSRILAQSCVYNPLPEYM